MLGCWAWDAPPVVTTPLLFPVALADLGSAWGNENLFLQAESIVWFRYHNHLAAALANNHSTWSDEDVFQHARKRVIATFQVRAGTLWLCQGPQ